jgi:hypothetical protein
VLIVILSVVFFDVFFVLARFVVLRFPGLVLVGIGPASGITSAAAGVTTATSGPRFTAIATAIRFTAPVTGGTSVRGLLGALSVLG